MEIPRNSYTLTCHPTRKRAFNIEDNIGILWPCCPHMFLPFLQPFGSQHSHRRMHPCKSEITHLLGVFFIKVHYMDNGDLFLPFEVAQEAESKCFDEGFRGAWFRCKIKEISHRKGVLGHHLEYFDYPDEKVRWEKLFKNPPYRNQGSALTKKMELMLRPRYPPFYRESDLPNGLPESDVVVAVNDTWKVGDLVDWWFDGCFWSGRISQLLGNDEVQELGNGWYCARLNGRHKQDRQRSLFDIADGKYEGIEVPADRIVNAYSFDDTYKNELGKFMKPSTKYDRYNLGSEYDTYDAVRKYLMSARSSSTLESSIMNLEKVSCRVRWLKGLLKFGFQWPDLMIPSWKFLETREVHLRR